MKPRGLACWMIAIFLIALIFLFVAIIITTAVLPNSNTRFYTIVTTVGPPPTRSTTTGPNTTITTTTETTTETTITTYITTTPFVPLTIMCPPNITIQLGSSLDPMITGMATSVAQSNPACGEPVVGYSDVSGGFVAKKKREIGSEREGGIMRSASTVIVGVKTGSDMLVQHMSVRSALNEKRLKRRRAGQVDNPNFKKRRVTKKLHKSRSPSFNASNLVVVPPTVSLTNTGADTSDANSDNNGLQVVTALDTIVGTYYYVTDATLSLVLAVFSAAASFGVGDCATTQGQGTVTWDYNASQWLLLELGMNNQLCLFISQGGDAAGGMWSAYQFNFTYLPDYPKLSVWGPQAYVITLNALSNNNCVLDRFAVVNLLASPILFCSTPIAGPLAGFTFQSWTGVHALAEFAPPDIETAGTFTNGAVFMRPNDDEMNANTPLAVDWIDLEQWTHIDFVNATYIPLTYRITIAEFDSSYANCQASDACIPTPTVGIYLDPLREIIMHRLAFRNGTAIATFVSNANGIDVARVVWVQLIWAPPTPSLAPQFIVLQNGVVPYDDGVHRFMSSASLDADGTLVIGYDRSSSFLYPDMAACSQLMNDPPNRVRDEIVAVPSAGTLIVNNAWGSFQSMMPLIGSTRTFYFSGQVTGISWEVRTTRLHVLGDIIVRTFFAQDLCNITYCTQEITEE